jgi:hypothetical protein
LGVLQVTIWCNQSDKGRRCGVILARSYTQGNEIWMKTDSLNQDDLLAIAELLRQAFSWSARQT